MVFSGFWKSQLIQKACKKIYFYHGLTWSKTVNGEPSIAFTEKRVCQKWTQILNYSIKNHRTVLSTCFHFFADRHTNELRQVESTLCVICVQYRDNFLWQAWSSSQLSHGWYYQSKIQRTSGIICVVVKRAEHKLDLDVHDPLWDDIYADQY